MERIIYALSGVLLALSAGLCTANSLATSEVRDFKFCEDPWAPYTLGVVGSPPEGGFALALFNELEQRLQMRFELMLLPWKRCLLWGKTGEFDGIMLLTQNLERSDYLSFTEPVHHDKNLVWFRADRDLGRTFERFEDFKGLRIGVTAGFNYGETFNAAVQNLGLTIDEGPTILSNLQRLALGRIDIFLVNKPAAEFALLDSADLRARVDFANGPFDAVPFFIGLSRASPAVRELDRFNAAIRAMADDGTLEKIFSGHALH